MTPNPQPNNRLQNTIQAVNNFMNQVTTLFRQRRWFELYVSIVCALILFLAPNTGFIYSSFSHILPNPKIYDVFFWIVIFGLTVACCLLLIYERARRARQRNYNKILFTILGFLILLFSYNTISSQIKIIPDYGERYLSYGEESLFLKGSPEDKIYQENKQAFKHLRKPWKIAISVPISRPNGNYHSNEFLRGVAIAQDEWNKKHSGFQAVIGIADDGYENEDYNPMETQAQKETKAAEKVASILVKQEDILAVIGHMGSDVTLAAAPKYNNELVVVSPSSTAKREKKDSCTPYESKDSVCFNEYVFRVALNDLKAAEFLVKAIVQKNKLLPEKISKVAIVYASNSTYSNSFKSAFKNKFDYEFGENSVVVDDKCDFYKANYKGKVCFDSVKEKAQAILLIPGELGTAVDMAEDIISANYSRETGMRLFLLGSDTMYQESFVVSKGEARLDTKGMLIPITWHRKNIDECSQQDNTSELECKAAQIFSSKEEIEQKKPLAINWRTATSYDATIAILNALKIARESNLYCDKPFSPERFNIHDCLRRNLKSVLISDDFNNLNIEGATSIIRFQDGKGREEIYGERDFTKDLGVVVEAKNKNFYKFPIRRSN